MYGTLCSPELLRLGKEEGDKGCDGMFTNCCGNPAVGAAREACTSSAALIIAVRPKETACAPSSPDVFKGSRTKAAALPCCRKSSTGISTKQTQQTRLPKEAFVVFPSIRETTFFTTVTVPILSAKPMPRNIEGSKLPNAGMFTYSPKSQRYETLVAKAAQVTVMSLEVEAKMQRLQRRITYMKPPPK